MSEKQRQRRSKTMHEEAVTVLFSEFGSENVDEIHLCFTVS